MNKFRYKLAAWLLKPLFNAVTADKVFRFDRKKGQFFYGNSKLSQEEVDQLSEEITILKKLSIWKLMTHEMKHIAQKQIFESATDEMGLIFPRSVFFVLETIDKKMDNIKRAARQLKNRSTD